MATLSRVGTVRGLEADGQPVTKLELRQPNDFARHDDSPPSSPLCCGPFNVLKNPSRMGHERNHRVPHNHNLPHPIYAVFPSFSCANPNLHVTRSQGRGYPSIDQRDHQAAGADASGTFRDL